jgi:hypothetical protein
MLSHRPAAFGGWAAPQTMLQLEISRNAALTQEQMSHTRVSGGAGSFAMKNNYMDYVEVVVLTVMVASCYLLVSPM